MIEGSDEREADGEAEDWDGEEEELEEEDGDEDAGEEEVWHVVAGLTTGGDLVTGVTGGTVCPAVADDPLVDGSDFTFFAISRIRHSIAS